MKGSFYILLCIILALGFRGAFAQSKSPAIWAFGFHGGLDFRSGQPLPFKSGMNAGESCAAQCSSTGELLFYTDGTRIWNRNHKVVPFMDSGINPDMTSSQQGANIISVPGDTSRYYVFRQTPLEVVFAGGTRGYINYSVIDMDLDNGNGDVVPGLYNISIDSFMSEKVTVIKNTDCSYWLVTHSMDTSLFKCYKITAAGIDPNPVISYSGSFVPDNVFASFGVGEMIYSPKHKKLFSTTPKGEGFSYYLEMHDFDPLTGIISNAQMLTDTNLGMYLCLSPDENKLYASGILFIGALFHGVVFQYDLSLPAVQSIINSKTRIFYDPGVNIADMLLGHDNKIYVVTGYNDTSLSRIENPDVAGTGCNFNLYAVPLANGTHTFAGLPSPGYLPFTMLYNTSTDTTVCTADSILLSAPAGYQKYRWSNKDTSAASLITTTGKYWVKSSNTCVEQNDTFNVAISNTSFSLGNDTAICEDMALTVPVKDATYKWNNGSTEANTYVNKTGRYSVLIKKGDCTNADTINIAYKRMIADLGHDTTLCNGTGITYNLFANNGTSYLWNDGSTEPVYMVSKPGIYTVRGDNGTCNATDTVSITYGECDCIVWMPNAFSPNGDGKNDYFAPVLNHRCPVKHYKLEVYNRWGQRIFASNSETVKWDGFDKSHIADVGTYMYQFEMTDIYDRKTYRKGDVTLVR